MDDAYQISPADINQFQRLDENKQAVILDAIGETVTVLARYVSGENDKLVKPIRQLKILHKDIFAEYGLKDTAKHFENTYMQLHTGIAAGDMKSDAIIAAFTKTGESLIDLSEALRKKAGGDAPLGDTVDFSNIKTDGNDKEWEDVKEAAYDEHEPVDIAKPPKPAHLTPSPRVSLSNAVPGQYQGDFFGKLCDRIKRYSRDERRDLSDFCADKGNYTDLSSRIRLDMGQNLITNPTFRRAVAACMDNDLEVRSAEEAQQEFREQQERSSFQGRGAGWRLGG